MTGQEHAQAAENLLAGVGNVSVTDAVAMMAAAQVQATLALTAAVRASAAPAVTVHGTAGPTVTVGPLSARIAERAA
jgi:acyl-coenzyme A synthetase/AMP-(fatty) acid ligase